VRSDPLAIVEGLDVATKGKDRKITESREEATQAENSPDTFIILVVSLGLLAAAAAALFWYFGVLPWSS
jgi:hypothetical protein